jgi:hypothetical protein
MPRRGKKLEKHEIWGSLRNTAHDEQNTRSWNQRPSLENWHFSRQLKTLQRWGTALVLGSYCSEANDLDLETVYLQTWFLNKQLISYLLASDLVEDNKEKNIIGLVWLMILLGIIYLF